VVRDREALIIVVIATILAALIVLLSEVGATDRCPQ
jgi:hypothetical protein